jgi:hypothetical protein
MTSVRKQVVGVWVMELAEQGHITQQEARFALDCLYNGDNIPLINLSRRTGDTTPLEILAAGWGSDDNTYIDSGRPCVSS